MKAKTRLLAVLLTLLMVVGILPLSLFALDEPLPAGTDGSGEYVDRTQQQIVDEFNRVGMTISKYQSFENLSNDTLDGLYNTSSQAILGYGQDWSQNGAWVDNTQYNDIDSKKGYISVADSLNAFEIVTEESGNSAIYLGDVAEGLAGENFFDFNGLNGGAERWQDQYISIDVKMKGDKIAYGPFFNVVLRPKSDPMFVNILNVNEDGELYIGNDVFGKLSKDEYTRVSVMLDRADNKYYVYINDVLVNLGGSELFSAENITEYNNIKGSSFTATDVPISSIRVYTVNSERTSGINEGAYFDNLIWGNRWELRDRDTAEQILVQSNFANATATKAVYPGGTLDANAFGTTNNRVAGTVDPQSIVYVDEDDDGVVDAMKYTKPANVTNQTFVNINVGSNNNVSFSADFKIGAGGLGNTVTLEHDHNNSNSDRQQFGIIVIEKSGNVKAYDGAKIGVITKDTYTNLRVDVVANGPKAKTGFVFYYVDGVLVYTALISETTSLYVRDEYVHTRGFRPYIMYNTGAVASLTEDDLHLTDILVKFTSAYNHLGSAEIPFAKNPPAGFIERGGVLRYSDGKGNYLTEDFFIGSTKYVVSNDAVIINKISGVLPERDLDDIRAEFGTQGLDVTSFNTFGNYPFAEGASIYNFLSENTVAAAGGYTVPVLPAGANDTQKAEYNNAVAELKTNLLNAGLLSTASGTPLHAATNMQVLSAYADLGNTLQIKNFRDSLSVRTEADGNKAMFYNWAPATVVPSLDNSNPKDNVADVTYHNDVFIDIYTGLPDSYKNQAGNGSHDIFLSIDLKMNGKVIPGGSLFDAIYRPEAYDYANNRTWLSLSDVGGIYLLNNYGPDSLIGFLSSEEYTRIALATDRLNNKFYVYINDVLVTPSGVEMWSQNEVDRMNTTNTRNTMVYTAATMPLCSVRTLNNSGDYTTDQNRGIWIDNIITGARIVTKDKTTAPSGFSYDFPSLGLADALGTPGTRILYKADGNIVGSFLGREDQANRGYASVGRPVEDDNTGTIRYVDETGPEGVPDGKADAIEWHAVAGCVDVDKPVKDEEDGGGPNPGQAFIGIQNKAAKGTNLRFSMDIKGGQDGQVGKGDFLMFRTGKGTNGSTADRTDVYLGLASDGTLKVNNSVAIGKITSDKYTNVTVDFVCNAYDGYGLYALWYVDGVLMLTQRFEIANAGGSYSVQDYHPSFVRIYSLYIDETKNLKDEDVRIRAMSYGSTTDYDTPKGRISVFENVLDGMYGIGGIVRCYNGDGTFKTADFELNGEKYIVSFGGNVIGKESDGRQFAPYAPYTDWEHTGTMVKSSPTGYYISGKGDGAGSSNTTITSQRDGFWKQGTMPNGDGVMLYTSYNDTEKGVGSPDDHATYITMDFGSLDGLKNKSVSIDVDLMMGEMFITKNTGTQPFFYLRGDPFADNTGGDKNRADKDFGEFYMSGDGWLLYNGKKLYKFSQTEYTRFSFVVHGPQLDGDTLTKPSSVDLYANGVLLVKGVQGKETAKYLRQLRFLKVCDSDLAFYVKDLYMYEATKPQQFMGMVGGVPTLVTDASVDAATMADMKQGFVKENGVIRYYDTLGLPIIGGSVTVDEKLHVADKNGVIETPCTADKHYGTSLDKGVCDICGMRFDGVTALYATSLILGTDVKVVFYLEVGGNGYTPTSETPYMEIGLERDYINGTTEKIYEPETAVIDGKTYVKVSYALSGKDICSDVKVRFVDGEFTGTEYVYSAVKYAEDVNALPTDAVYTDELKALANALVVYGKNAAAVLAGGEAAEAIGEVDFSTVANASGNPDINVGAIKLNKFSLELKSNIKLKVYFSFDENNMMMNYWEDYIVTVNGEPVEPELVDEENKIYCIEIDVVAAKLGETFAIRVLHYLDGGLELNISPLYYAKVMVASGKASEAEINLMKAIKLYADAAVAYAEGIAEDSRPAV